MAVERIGKYRILARLGQGGMARVMLTMADGPHGFHKLLVVKELRDELAHDPEFLTMFLDEARIAARLNHPNIVQTYEIGSDGDRYFIAMEYLEGQPLNAVYRRLGRANIPVEVHLRILADVLAGLEHAHGLADFDGTPLGVVHRDVSPQNVFVTYEGQVKLVDFGIAKVAGAATTTQEGVLKGKIAYIAPEQARCDTVDARADLFTVGLMLWEALAGRRLVVREDQTSVLARRINGQDPLIRTVVPDLDPELAAICDRAMASRPEDRFQTAREFHDALERHLAKSDVRVGPKTIGRLVSDAFEDERTRIRKAIEEQVKNVDHGRAPIQLELQSPSLTQTSDSLPRVVIPLPIESVPTPLPSATPPPLSVSPPRRSRSSLPLALGAVVLLAGVAGVVHLTRQGAPRPPGPAASQPEGPTPVGTIAVAVRFPEGARASLDGVRLEQNPLVTTAPKDGSRHQLVVEREGFETVSRSVIYDGDVDLAIELVPVPSTTAEPTAAPERAVRSPAGRAPRPASPADEKTTRRDEPAAPRTPPRSPVEIDENNPYKKKAP